MTGLRLPGLTLCRIPRATSWTHLHFLQAIFADPPSLSGRYLALLDLLWPLIPYCFIAVPFVSFSYKTMSSLSAEAELFLSTLGTHGKIICVSIKLPSRSAILWAGASISLHIEPSLNFTQRKKVNLMRRNVSHNHTVYPFFFLSHPLRVVQSY